MKSSYGEKGQLLLCLNILTYLVDTVKRFSGDKENFYKNLSRILRHAIFTLHFTPRVDSPDETGEVARVSAPKGGRAVEPAAVATLLIKQ